MMNIRILGCLFCMLIAMPALAEEGYRYMHVTIETPWAIFLFLLVIVLFPFLLMAILYWYFAFKKNKEESGQGSESATK